jgi:GDPmannose 4,6-dehydratase
VFETKFYQYGGMAVNYRDGYHLFVCNGLLFNHESPRRADWIAVYWARVTRLIGEVSRVASVVLGCNILAPKRAAAV